MTHDTGASDTGKGGRDYAAKRAFTATPEPEPQVAGDVDPGSARAGDSFVIHQHHARRLHFDLRLEMFNGDVPVLVSWAVPKNLPREPKQKVLAVHVEDHPFEYGRFSGSIPAGNYGAGEVRIFDSGTYEMLEQAPGKLTFRLEGSRMRGVFHLIQTRSGDGDQWLAFLRSWEGPEPEPLPPANPMLPGRAAEPFDDEEWAFEPRWQGERIFAFCDRSTILRSPGGEDVSIQYPRLAKAHERVVAWDGVLDGTVVTIETGSPPVYMTFDLLYLDGRSLAGEPYLKRRELLEAALVPSEFMELTPSVSGPGKALFGASVEQGLTGVVAKKHSSRYRPGRSKEWLEILTAS